MRGKAFTSVGLLAVASVAAFGGNVAPVRDPSVSIALTPGGPAAVKVTPVTPGRDVYLIVLSDSLASEDLSRIRNEVPSALSGSLLSGHSVYLVNVAGAGAEISSPLTTASELQTALKHLPGGGTRAFGIEVLNTLGGFASNIRGGWCSAIVVCRFPAVPRDEVWVSAWLGEIYRRQRVRLSFWSLEGTAPAWAQSVAAASLGLVSTSTAAALKPVLTEDSGVFEAAWESPVSKGAWPYQAELKNAAGEIVASFPALAGGPNFLPPLSSYLSARAAMLGTAVSDEQTLRTILEMNPGDADALRRLAVLLEKQGNLKESAAAWRDLSEVMPRDGGVWAELGATLYAAGAAEDSARAIDRAAELGVRSRSTLEARARICLRNGDFAGALAQADQALLGETPGAQEGLQSLWLLRAECAGKLQRWPIEAESLEHAAAISVLPLDRSSRLIAGYLAADDVAHAVPHLREATKRLPAEAPVRAEYAEYWERAHESSSAEPLWKGSVEADGKFEPGYVGLAKHYLAAHRAAEALQVADTGLTALPASLPLTLAKESALEDLGDIEGARRLLRDLATGSHDDELLKRRAFLEDAYGSAAAETYAARLERMAKNETPQRDVVELCRRGLLVSIRDAQPKAAALFADKLASAGERMGPDLLRMRKSSESSSFELPGGVEAFRFLLFGGGKSTPERILVDYSRVLAAAAPASHEVNATKQWISVGSRIHEYFRVLAALSALGERKQGEIEIDLTVANKRGKQLTEKVFGILGLKLKSNKEGVAVKSAEGKAEAQKQETLAALAIDDAAIQETLAAGKTYRLQIPMDAVPVFPSVDFWQKVFGDREQCAGGLAEALVTDPRDARLFYALNSMDRATAGILARGVSIRMLEEHYSSALSLYSAALAVHGSGAETHGAVAETPGGAHAAAIWTRLTGANPADPVPFFEALLNKDDGRLIAFFYSLSQLDFQHQQFFTRSAERLKRFYDLFRDSAEMRRGGEHRIGYGPFVEFLREVPLNDDLSVDFPGSPEVWMVAKGRSVTASSVAKMSRKMKRSVAPDSEDEILVRLATSAYKSHEAEESELANFIATVRIDEQRQEPLSPEAALLLAQGYSSYQGLYGYFAQLGNLDAADYQKLFTLNDHFNGLDLATANLRLGQVHSFLAMLGLLHGSGRIPEKDLIAIYRKGVDRYAAASGPAAWTTSSLSALDDLAHLAGPEIASRDSSIRTLLLGPSASARRQKQFAEVVAMQKSPSLDALFSIWSALQKPRPNASAMAEVQRQLSSFVVLPWPKAWRLQGNEKKSFELFETAHASSVVSRMRENEAKRKVNPAELERLASDLTGDLEPWVELAMVSRIYARYLDPTDLVVSEDPLLVRKHQFTPLGSRSSKLPWFASSALEVASTGEGSYFSGGLAEFAVSAGEARAEGNHVGGRGGSFATAVFASIRATDWASITRPALQSFGASIRLAREWIVESAISQPARQALEQETLGVLSLNRRHSLIDALDRRDWAAVWHSVSVSDLYFLGQALIEDTGKSDDLQDVWKLPAVLAMREAAVAQKDLNALGSVAPSLNGCGQPRLRRYAPYEDYERYALPDRMAQRSAELKLYLAWIADGAAWAPDRLEGMAEAAGDKLLNSVQFRDQYDWSAFIEGYEKLSAENLEALVSVK